MRTRLKNPMRLALLACSVLILAACQTSSEAPSSGPSAVTGTSGGEIALLLTEEAAASILRDFLIDCIESWNVVHGPTSTPNPTVTPTPPTPESDATKSVGPRTRGWTYDEWMNQLAQMREPALYKGQNLELLLNGKERIPDSHEVAPYLGAPNWNGGTTLFGNL